MAAFHLFKLSSRDPRNSSSAQLKIWIDELSSYEHELLMEIAYLSRMVRKRYTPVASAAVQHYKTLLSDIRQIREMFEIQEINIRDSSKHIDKKLKT